MWGFGENIQQFIPLCAFFFKVEISLRTLIPLISPGSVHSCSVSWDDCDQVFPDEVWAATLCLDSGLVSPLQVCLVKGVSMFRRNLPPELLAEWLGSFTCHCRNTEWNGHQIRVSTQSWHWRRKFSRYSCRDSNLQPLDHESGTLTTSYPAPRPHQSLVAVQIIWTMWQVNALSFTSTFLTG